MQKLFLQSKFLSFPIEYAPLYIQGVQLTKDSISSKNSISSKDTISYIGLKNTTSIKKIYEFHTKDSIQLSPEIQERWRKLESIYWYGNRWVTGRILNSVRGGYSVGVYGIVGFLPKNQILKLDLHSFGKLKTFKIMNCNSKRLNLSLSRLEVENDWCEWNLLKKL